MRSIVFCLLASALLATPLLAAQSATEAQTAAQTSPADFQAADAVMLQAVHAGQIPGGVLVVVHNGKTVFRKAYGYRQLEPTREAASVDTIYDLASLTKCVATTSSVLRLLEEGRIRLNAPVAEYLPEFAQNGKADITLRELLTHYSGLTPDLDLSAPWKGRESAYQMVMRQHPIHTPGTRFEYSDINFLTLGFLVERVTGMSLDEYARKAVFAPLGMTETGYLPAAQLTPRIAATQWDEEHRMLRGTVHDPTARRMGGVAGHAGVFSTADDLAKFALAILHGSPVFSPSSIAKMSTPQQPANGSALRGLGWDIDSPFSSNRGELLPIGSFGHTGYTGTSLWIDPTTDTAIILLTNAVHPDDSHSAVSLRTRIATAVTDALALTPSQQEQLRLARITGYNESLMASRRIVARNGSVRLGIDLLAAHHFAELHPDPAHPLRVGIITNQTGMDSAGHRTIDLIAQTPGLQVTAIFSPEHGIAGALDTTEISDSRDAATHAPIYSVYGDTESKRRPTADQLANVDLLLFDIQDAGVRFYTFETTLGYFLEAAAQFDKPIVVTDRPNPIGGTRVEGPIADPGSESFVAYWQTPIRHGMTVAELARLFNAERKINARLITIPMEGWQRGDWFDSTGLLWQSPSPNLRSLTEAILYPGIGLIEQTNISVGRGTDTPFELIGAPFIDPVKLAATLNAREIPGIRFLPIRFTPSSSTYANQSCGGVRFLVTDREQLDPTEAALELIASLRQLYPADYKIDELDKLLRSKPTLDAITAGQDPQRISLDWQQANAAFTALRSKYLLY